MRELDAVTATLLREKFLLSCGRKTTALPETLMATT
jgi:hypothetical protein